MTLSPYAKAPFPYAGGKSRAAGAVWDAMGDVMHYVEPFCGSLATLLNRPHVCHRPYHSETANDADGLLVNAYRSIQWSPDATAAWASWPVCEADMLARELALLAWAQNREVDRLMGDWRYHDPRLAGFWLYGMSAYIGAGYASGSGPWAADEEGRLVRRGRPGVSRKRPSLHDDGAGVHGPPLREPWLGEEPEFYPMVMPSLRRWFHYLSARLRHVRILTGDWRRVVTPATLKTLSVRDKGGAAGVFLDPPYHPEERSKGIYTHDGSAALTQAVRDWCLAHGDDPQLRIVLAGFAGEGHEVLEGHGWRVVEWYTRGYLSGGYGKQGAAGDQHHRERLWLSPHCLVADKPRSQMDLFALRGHDA